MVKRVAGAIGKVWMGFDEVGLTVRKNDAIRVGYETGAPCPKASFPLALSASNSALSVTKALSYGTSVNSSMKRTKSPRPRPFHCAAAAMQQHARGVKRRATRDSGMLARVSEKYDTTQERLCERDSSVARAAEERLGLHSAA